MVSLLKNQKQHPLHLVGQRVLTRCFYAFLVQVLSTKRSILHVLRTNNIGHTLLLVLTGCTYHTMPHTPKISLKNMVAKCVSCALKNSGQVLIHMALGDIGRKVWIEHTKNNIWVDEIPMFSSLLSISSWSEHFGIVYVQTKWNFCWPANIWTVDCFWCCLGRPLY